jgi:small-conductance mechanosensitive channel
MAQAQELAPPPGSAQNIDQAVNLNPAFVFNTVESWVVGFQKLLPNIVVAFVVFGLFAAASWAARRSLARWAKRRNRENLGDVLGSFVLWGILLLGLLVSLTIVVPSLHPGDLLAGLGVGSVAIGFAFKDILQNWLAGLLLLIRQPFHIGDQIVVKGYEGTVNWIETRATIITTYDGRRVIIPNAEVYSNAVMVNTANEIRRSQYDVGIGYGDSIERAREVILAAIATIPEVHSDPEAEVLVWDLEGSSVVLRVRWWTQSKRTQVVHIKARVLEAIKNALDEAGIDMPFPTQVMLFLDQTEDVDGQRGRQREGWPRRGGETSTPARERRIAGAG